MQHCARALALLQCTMNAVKFTAAITSATAVRARVKAGLRRNAGGAPTHLDTADGQDRRSPTQITLMLTHRPFLATALAVAPASRPLQSSSDPDDLEPCAARTPPWWHFSTRQCLAELNLRNSSATIAGALVMTRDMKMAVAMCVLAALLATYNFWCRS